MGERRNFLPPVDRRGTVALKEGQKKNEKGVQDRLQALCREHDVKTIEELNVAFQGTERWCRIIAVDALGNIQSEPALVEQSPLGRTSTRSPKVNIRSQMLIFKKAA